MVQIGRCVEAQSFAWPVVQVIDDVVALGLRYRAHAGALGQVLSDQAVEVLVAASLPRVVRRGEVDRHREARFEQAVVTELGAVVEGDRLEHAAVPSDGSGCRSRDFVLGARFQLLDDGVPAKGRHESVHLTEQGMELAKRIEGELFGLTDHHDPNQGDFG
jgi:hypothetical protein